ncbi:hypothetical protein DRW48_14075 [Paracoccus suum]|uniref:Uncharacterized protein n=1 Tax=Paracoccus suum TaxID=2259340 RepID=A0A344PMQ3_9RHOB|nr:hypothetical protein DRW48_14075 [Paracoccus suum]
MTREPRQPQSSASRPDKDTRRAEALRANLHRRKAQARARSAQGTDASDPDASREQAPDREG